MARRWKTSGNYDSYLPSMNLALDINEADHGPPVLPVAA